MSAFDELDRRKAALSMQQRAALQRRIRSAKSASKSAIPPVSSSAAVPLSFSQERIWFHEQLVPGSIVYNRPANIQLRGPLQINVLRQALNHTVSKHDSIWVSIGANGPYPTLRTHPHTELAVPLTDLTHEPDPRAIALRLSLEESRRLFKPNQVPLLRSHLLRIGSEDYRLLLTFHHLAFDAWSQAVLLRELAAAYGAFSASVDPECSRAPIQYLDFAAWDRSDRRIDALAGGRGYWQRELADPPTLQLPTDFPRSAQPSEDAGHVEFELAPQLVMAIRTLARREDTTFFATALAAYQTLLYRYSGERDLVVGCPVAGRSRIESEEIIGVFVNTLPLRIRLDGDETFRRFLRRVGRMVIAGLAHQEVPQQFIVQDVLKNRHVTGSPLFQTMLIYERFPVEPRTSAGVTFEPEDMPTPATMTDLSLELTEVANHVTGRMNYRLELWEQLTVERMVGHFLTILEGIVANADQRISKLPLLTERERHQLLLQSNDTAVEYPHEKCVHELFEQQVDRTPNAVAVALEDQQLTYRELNQHANRLAHYLRNLGVGPETVVPLLLDRSLETIVAILGVLKAGGAYLPMDVTQPTQRLTFVLADCQALVLLTQQRFVEGLPSFDGQILCLDSQWDLIATRSSVNPTGETTCENLAYVIYTSGSTGKPKGVMVTHTNVSRLFTATEQWFQFSSTDVWTMFHSYAFDFSVWEMWGALLYGGRLVIVPYWISRSPRDFHQLLRREQVTVLNQTPRAFDQLVVADREADAEPQTLNLRLMFFAGEELNLGNLRPWFDRHGDESPQLVNMYGITETTVHVTYCPLSEADLSERSRSPIGWPLADLQVYVFDRHGELAPVGVPGELHVGGAGVARGYFNRRELTEERFIPHPLSNDPEDRLYKSGDVVCWRADGSLEYLGRSDDQVQLRGFRIEPGEIESVLVQHSAVAQCKLIVREDRPGDQRLVAYIVPQGDAAPTTDSLRQYLSDQLPGYMVPSAFVRLTTLPLNANGKVDRSALLPPDETPLSVDTSLVPASTNTERRLAEIWMDVLGVRHLGVEDDFIALGGDSLSAAQAINYIYDVFGVRLSYRTLFDASTVAAIAKRIDASAKLIDSPRYVPIGRRGGIDRAPLSFGQEQLLHFIQRYPDLPAYNETFTIRFHETVAPAVIRRCLDEIVRRHEVLRTAIVTEPQGPMQVIMPDVTVDLKTLDVRGDPEATRERRVEQNLLAEARRPFNTSSPPLMRAVLAVLTDDDHRLYVIFHHIVIDAIGFYVVFLDELWQLFEVFQVDKPSPLGELEIQYADYAAWQRQSVSQRAWDAHLKYWKEHLADASPLALPTDRQPRGPPTFRGRQQRFHFPKELADALVSLARREGVTTYTVLLAAFQTLLGRYAGQDDVVVGSVSTGRQRSETEPLLGYFLNTFPLRTDLSSAPTFRELLSQVQEVVVQALAHDDLPFVKLVEALPVARGPGEHPFFRVLFVLEPSMQGHPSGWTVSQMDIHPGTTKFDLTLEMEVRPEGILGRFEYSTDLFESASVERMVEHLRVLLEGITADPGRPIGSLPLLPDEERQQLVVEWNDTDAAYPRDKCVHELFEEQVERMPDAVALIFKDQQLTYRELNQRANQLAQQLQNRGVGPETLVALYLERSLEMVIGILGILKAGGAYVPLALDSPPQRLELMLRDASAKLLVTVPHLLGQLPRIDWETICLDGDAATLQSAVRTNPRTEVRPDNLAYVMFTSGSTGRPKGVQVPHGAVVNFLTAMAAQPGLTSDDRLLSITTPTFDISVLELLLPLTVGACIDVVSSELVSDAAGLAAHLSQSSATVMQATPATWQMLIQSGWDGCRNLKVLCGGEALTDSLAEALDRRCGELWNMYGTTETTVYSTTLRVSEGSVQGSIGRPLANTQVYVLDTQQRPVPIGVPGELYIGGAGLARGYLNRPELSTDRFVANPFDDDRDSRLYCTGDLCRWRADGNLEFLGRLDDQVKLRGFRIELGEIESVLLRHPDVAQSAVVLREDRPEEKRLVAYCVPVAGTELSFSELRSHLRDRLPNYMLPTAFVGLDELPMIRGKINRRALPAPEDSRPELETGCVAPQNVTEKQLASIWCEVLGIEQVGRHDNFFALGGHSLSAQRVKSRIVSAFQVDLPLSRIFEAQTIAELASEISRHVNPG